MAQQIVIDIIAETRKLQQGVDQANTQLGSLNDKFKGVAAAAGAAASAFILREGVTFLKGAVDEAVDAQKAMNSATAAFGEGSAALQKVTADAEAFGKQLAVDNDDILKLATNLGTYLPEEAKGLSAELVNLGYDISAVTGIDVEAWTKKLAKGMADGTLSGKDMQKMFPGLEQATYDQAEAMFEAGKAQDALNLLMQEGQKTYGDAAEKNVTGAQRMKVALANLQEVIGTRLVPVVEKLTAFLTKLIDAFVALPKPVQNLILVLTALVGIGGPVLGFFASLKTSLDVLTGGIKLAQIAQSLLNFTILGFPGTWIIAGIAALIAIIVLLVKNWDTVTEVVGKVWNKIKEFGALVVPFIKDIVGKIGEFFKNIGEKVIDVVKDIIDAYLAIPKKMLEIGKNIVTSLFDGIKSMASWLKDKVMSFFGNILPDFVKKALGIASPSKVFKAIGQNVMDGFAQPLTATRVPALQTSYAGRGGAPVNITINAGLGTDPYALGREVNNALGKYSKVSSRVNRGN